MKFENLKKTIKRLSTYINNPSISAKISQSYNGSKEIYEEVKKSIDWFNHNFDSTVDLLISGDMLDEFERETNEFLKLTKNSSFDVQTFLNLCSYFNDVKNSMDKSESTVDVIVKQPNISVCEDLIDIMKDDIKKYRKINEE